ncbi:restriction endonuclease subunit S [Alteromonas stellipolaris]|uniref:restriction endonuclease subunit S n=1 Tax=Alteromonas stellipolaris TaxID=233316 RepID=UPI00211750DA|nr:restriction endonuclease subunit S [Alteromonas stellipolaris]MCQ8849063.1 restriction endonuclease subunit S [Alteromonas stellipolaris]
MSSDWPEYSLTELYDISSGLSKPAKDFGSGYPFVSFKDVFANYFLPEDLGQLVQSSDKEREKASVKKGDVFLTRTSETMHELGMSSVALKDYENATFNGFTKRLRVKPEMAEFVVPEFIAYSLRSPSFRTSMLAFSTMSTRASLNNEMISRLKIKLPKVDTQRKIGNVLKCLDDKIALNKQLNEKLELIAQAIFKSWFVDFEPTKAKIAAREALLAENPAATPEQIATAEQQAAIQAIAGAGDVIPTERLQAIAELFPNQFVDSELGEIPYGWEIKALDQIANYQNGLALQKFRPESGEDFLPVLKIAQLKAGFADGKEVAKASIKKECIVDNGDVIFSWSGSLVVDIWCGGRVALNQHLFKVTSNTYPKWFFYKWTKYHLEKFQQIAADKAVTMGHIKRSHLSEAKCLIPASELIKNKFISSLIDKQVQVRLESKVLSDVRDSLLPRLLAGEFSLAKVDSEHE